MSELKIWFLDVGHGDCTYIELPNGARMMIDCGGGNNHWPSKMLKNSRICKGNSLVPNIEWDFALDSLVISHPHLDHYSDISALNDEIGFYLFTGGYLGFIDKIAGKMDVRQRDQATVNKFIEIVKGRTGKYEAHLDRVAQNVPTCVVTRKRFLNYEDDIDLNDLSWVVSVEFGGHKVLFPGDLTADGVKKVLRSNRAKEFADLVKGTTFLKVSHHGRINGCSQEMLDLFGQKPYLCILSDEVLNQRNEGTANTQWYTDRTSDINLNINGELKSRKVLTTRSDKDIYLRVSENGSIYIGTNVFKDKKEQILKS